MTIYDRNDVEPQASLTSVLHIGASSALGPGRVTPREEPTYLPIAQTAGWAPEADQYCMVSGIEYRFLDRPVCSLVSPFVLFVVRLCHFKAKSQTVFENKVIRRISGPTRQETGEGNIMRNLITCTSLLNTVRMVKSCGDDIGRTCGMQEEKSKQVS
jgi:hypothetical protein